MATATVSFKAAANPGPKQHPRTGFRGKGLFRQTYSISSQISKCLLVLRYSGLLLLRGRDERRGTLASSENWRIAPFSARRPGKELWDVNHAEAASTVRSGGAGWV
jgi:hypothetical protein